MTPKEKAKEIYQKCFEISPEWLFEGEAIELSKQYALIAVENEYNAKIQAYNEMAEFCPDISGQAVFYANKEKEQVKKEIKKL